jgi:hypothetical protein
MPEDLIEAFFSRDLSPKEEARLAKLLAQSEDAALSFSRRAEEHYAKLGWLAALWLAVKTGSGKGLAGTWAQKLLWSVKAMGVKAVATTAVVATVGVAGTAYVVLRHSAPPAPQALPEQGDGLNIELQLGSAKDLGVVVYSGAGLPVRRLGRLHLEAGTHKLSWDGLDDQGRAVPPGRYRVDVDLGGSHLSRWLEVR